MIIKPGTIIKDENSEYVIEEVIGEGGFGFVYKVKNMTNGLIYAVKTVSTSFQDDSKLEAFQNEIKMAIQITSPNVINYIFAHDGTAFPELPPYIIMDYANQGTLTNILKKQKLSGNFFDNSQLLEMFIQLSNGMSSINAKLVHRDIKPDNILVDNSQLKITDFGLSKVAGERTRTMSFKGYGTLKYIAPEAWNNDKNTIQMDIYSMGIVFYELTTLQHPYKVVNDGDVSLWKEAHLYCIPDNPKNINRNISPTIASLIMKMLEKSTPKRFANWDEIMQYLATDKTEKSDIDGIINSMLNSRLQKDTTFQKEKTEEERKKKENADFCKLVKYQYNASIFSFLHKFIDNFNSKYPNGNIRLESNNNYNNEKMIKNTIKLVSGRVLEIEIIALLESDFIRTREYNDFGEIRKRTKIEMPLLNTRKVLAWGRLYTQEQTGFNIFLLEKTGEIYGEWVLMENTNSGLSRSRRPEPFGFDLSELEKEINLVKVTHIYNSKIFPLDINKFYEYIFKYNN
jgi:eukaryotic-like serine/threonine-protein kinase